MLDDEIKQVIVIRTDLNLGKGKAVTQGAHGSVKSALMAMQGNIEADNGFPDPSPSHPDANPDTWRQWFATWDQNTWDQGGYKKVTLKIDTEEDLIAICRKAWEAGLPAFLVRDAGRTQLEKGTWTACAIGPAPSSLIDPFTRNLKLL